MKRNRIKYMLYTYILLIGKIAKVTGKVVVVCGSMCKNLMLEVRRLLDEMIDFTIGPLSKTHNLSSLQSLNLLS